MEDKIFTLNNPADELTTISALVQRRTQPEKNIRSPKTEYSQVKFLKMAVTYIGPAKIRNRTMAMGLPNIVLTP
jgi:hypothetical protein